MWWSRSSFIISLSTDGQGSLHEHLAAIVDIDACGQIVSTELLTHQVIIGIVASGSSLNFLNASGILVVGVTDLGHGQLYVGTATQHSGSIGEIFTLGKVNETGPVVGVDHTLVTDARGTSISSP